MKRLFGLALVGLFATATTTWAGIFSCLPSHCICPPPAPCRDCGCPCDGHHHCSARKSQHAHELICQLQACCECSERLKLVEKLGCRLHADFCCDPEVLEVLICTLQCDSCWEVRKAAAWAIAKQGARTPEGAMALYIASKVDPHYMVRDRAIMAMDVLLVCRKECFQEQFKQGDDLVKELKKNKWKPGSENCRVIFQTACATCGVASPAPMASAPAITTLPAAPATSSAPPAIAVPSKTPEPLPLPRD